MRTQLFCSMLLAGAILVAGCSREEARDNTQEAAAEVKQGAAKVGDQLSDSWLTTKIQAQYFADEDVKARHINVSTRNAVVTLSGFVGSEAQRQEALEIARNTDGVVRVEDRLQMAASAHAGSAAESGAAATTGTVTEAARNAADTVDDAQLTAKVQAKYFVDDLVKGRRIDVDTRDGVVTLSGEVATEEERAQALRLAREIDGVKRVEDHLQVMAASGAAQRGGRADDAALTTTIYAKYFVDTTVKNADIDVTAKDGVVLLEGTVPDEAARQQALAIARNTEGVVQVVDKLTVTAIPR